MVAELIEVPDPFLDPSGWLDFFRVEPPDGVDPFATDDDGAAGLSRGTRGGLRRRARRRGRTRPRDLAEGAIGLRLVEPGDPADDSVERRPVGQARRVLERLLAAAPGAAAVQALDAIDAARLDAFERVLYAQAWDRQRSWLEARTVAADIAVIGVEPLDEHDSGTFEWQLGLRRTKTAAHDRSAFVRALTSHLPATLPALQAGVLTPAHAFVLYEELRELPAALAAAVEAEVLAGSVEEWTTRDLGEQVRRAIIRADASAAAERERTARTKRRVWMRELPDAQAMLGLVGPAAEIIRIYNSAHAWARAALDAGRADRPTASTDLADSLAGAAAVCTDRMAPTTLDRAMYDVIRDRLLGDAPVPAPVEIGVLATLPMLLGLTEDPAFLTGYGPIPAPVARALAAEDGARWRRLLTDPDTGALLDRGARTYRPSAALRAFLIARDGTCRTPGCSTAAARCDLDHRAPWPHGPTTRDNLEARCRRHHGLKTAKIWTVVAESDGTSTIVTAAGHRYSTRPVDYRIGDPPQPERQATGMPPPAAHDDAPPF